MVQYEIRIEGRVQGVGFRYFVEKRAAEWHITGWVKNNPDGSVLVMARGEHGNMETFLESLQSGPPLARVDRIFKTAIPVQDEFSGFRVRY